MMLETVFKKRRAKFLERCLKYARYVFNDHFVLVLFVLFGFVMVQYSSLLRHFPKQHGPIILILGLLSLVMVWLGNLATYMEPADRHYLLAKEDDLHEMIKKARNRAYGLWSFILLLVFLLLAPLFFKLGLSKGFFALYLFVLLLIKGFIFEQKRKQFFVEGKLNWTKAIALETKRQQSILKFFSLFTTVKGISSSVKRRQYLDFLLKYFPKVQGQLWSNLYLRAFLRSGDYLGLSIRLGLLSLLSLVFIPNRMVAVALVLLFNYLLLFQLTALFHHFDYQYMTQLLPVDKKKKEQNLVSFIKKVLYILTVIEMLFVLSLEGLVILLAGMILLNEIYLRYKVRKMID